MSVGARQIFRVSGLVSEMLHAVQPEEAFLSVLGLIPIAQNRVGLAGSTSQIARPFAVKVVWFYLIS
jgi:hypothetical protein